MKKLYSKGGKVHPTPPAIADRLSLLPATILTLTVALSPEDKEVLAYLISCSGTSTNFSGSHHKIGGGGDHPTQFNCNCFRCYMSYWVRWDTSPNRQLIHEILDAYEDGLFRKKKNLKVKKERRKRVSKDEKNESGELESVDASGGKREVEVASGGEEGDPAGSEKGSVRKLMSFIGERIWGVWGI